MAELKASPNVRVYADCPHCKFTGEVFNNRMPDSDGFFDNAWRGGAGAFRVTCDSCGEPFAITRDGATHVQHLALCLLGEDVFNPELDDEQLCEAVASLLTLGGFNAEAQYTGGGIWCVSIAEPGRPNASWLCGMSADDWGGTLMEADSYAPYEGPEDGGEMQLLHCQGISSDSQATANIAAGIATEIREWRKTHVATVNHADA